MIKCHADMHQDVIALEIDGAPKDVAFELAAVIRGTLHTYFGKSEEEAAIFYGSLVNLLIDDNAFDQKAEKHLDRLNPLS